MEVKIGLVLIFSACLIAACTPTQPRITDTQTEPPLPSSVIGGRPNACLAFSGGGIRSGAVSIGILQALHADGLLEKFQLMTSVSGGGYPVAGILQQIVSNSRGLDSLLDENGSFILNMESRADFVTKLDATFDSILTGISIPIFGWFRPFWSKELILEGEGHYLYQLAIRRTFGEEPLVGPLYWDYLDSVVPEELGGFPYPIFVASSTQGFSAPRSGQRYSASDVFEISPQWIGSLALGYWSSSTEPRLTIAQAVAASAAAIDSPGGDGFDEVLPEWLRRIGFSIGLALPGPEAGWVYVSDGGFIDNLGLVPLVSRKCRNILALDASSDPGAAFGNWETFKAVVEDIGGHASPAVEPVGNKGEASQFNGWTLPTHTWKATVDIGGLRSDIIFLKLGLVEDMVATYDEEISGVIEQQIGDSPLGDVSCATTGIFGTRCPFPLEAIGRQAFSPEEFRAYRKLGAFMVGEFTKLPPALVFPK